jgi:hypothetical protein
LRLGRSDGFASSLILLWVRVSMGIEQSSGGTWHT